MRLRWATLCTALLLPAAARASFLSGDTLDTVANALSWFIIFLVPVVGIGAFLFVHVLPEKIAEKQHHPQKHAIKVLCILSLFFGGLLWPLAWLWAYTRPVVNRAVYGTERHEDYYIEQGELALTGKLPADEIQHLRAELATMAAKGPLAPHLRLLSESLDLLPAAAAARAAPAPQAATGGSR